MGTISLKINDSTLKFLDEKILENKYSKEKLPKNRTEYIENVLDNYWKIKYGISYIVRRK